MKLWVFSDLHLEASDLYQEFLSVLDQQVQSQDIVVFAGDIFDLFVGGSPHFKAKFSDFFIVLRKLEERQVQLHYIFGNHDFNLSRAFGDLRIQLHDESVEFTVGAAGDFKKIYIAHGDLVDQTDVNYLRLRKLFRSAPMRALSTVLPGSWIERFGNLISRKSDQKVVDLPESWTQENRQVLRKKFREFASAKHRQGFDFVILGHCHDLDEQTPFYWNMGYPPVHRQYLCYDSEIGKFLRHKFTEIPHKNCENTN